MNRISGVFALTWLLVLVCLTPNAVAQISKSLIGKTITTSHPFTIENHCRIMFRGTSGQTEFCIPIYYPYQTIIYVGKDALYFYLSVDKGSGTGVTLPHNGGVGVKNYKDASYKYKVTANGSSINVNLSSTTSRYFANTSTSIRYSDDRCTASTRLLRASGRSLEKEYYRKGRPASALDKPQSCTVKNGRPGT